MNILEYIKENKEELTSKNINNIDMLILSEIIYFKFERFFEKYNVESLRIKDLTYTLDNSLQMYNDTKIELAKAVSVSTRFMNILISDFIYELNPSITKQFSGLTFHIGEDLIIPTYRGTDNTFTGWKENFEMTYKTSVPAMTRATEYLNNISKKYPGEIIVTGHSKGGILSIYAASTFNGDLNRIRTVYSFDGPGFNNDFTTSKGYVAVKDKIVKFKPYDSLFGALLDEDRNYKTIKANNSFLHSHSPYNWLVDNNEFVYASGASERSLKVADEINDFFKVTDNQLLEEYTEKIFRVLSLNNIKYISDVTSNPFILLQLSQVISSFDPKSRASIMQIARDIMSINSSISNN